MFLSTAPNTLKHYMELVAKKLQPVNTKRCAVVCVKHSNKTLHLFQEKNIFYRYFRKLTLCECQYARISKHNVVCCMLHSFSHIKERTESKDV